MSHWFSGTGIGGRSHGGGKLGVRIFDLYSGEMFWNWDLELEVDWRVWMMNGRYVIMNLFKKEGMFMEDGDMDE
jgi:hypothetical protein